MKFSFEVESDKAVLRIGECMLVFEADGLEVKGCGARLAGEYRGERWRRYIYLEMSGLDATVLRAAARSSVCGRKGSVIRGSFMLSCSEASGSGVLVVVTPGFFLYERAILSPGLVTIELIGDKGFEASGGPNDTRIVFKRTR